MSVTEFFPRRAFKLQVLQAHTPHTHITHTQAHRATTHTQTTYHTHARTPHTRTHAYLELGERIAEFGAQRVLQLPQVALVLLRELETQRLRSAHAFTQRRVLRGGKRRACYSVSPPRVRSHSAGGVRRAQFTAAPLAW